MLRITLKRVTLINKLKSAADRILPTTGTLSQMGMEHIQQFQGITSLHNLFLEQ